MSPKFHRGIGLTQSVIARPLKNYCEVQSSLIMTEGTKGPLEAISVYLAGVLGIKELSDPLAG